MSNRQPQQTTEAILSRSSRILFDTNIRVSVEELNLNANYQHSTHHLDYDYVGGRKLSKPVQQFELHFAATVVGAYRHVNHLHGIAHRVPLSCCPLLINFMTN